MQYDPTTSTFIPINSASIQLGSTTVSPTSPAYIIAEGGINHQGEPEIAKNLIDLAKKCGANCIKFQKRTISRILTKEGLQRPYDTPNSFGPTYGEHKKHLEFDFDTFRELKKYADEKGIHFTASGWDEESVDFLDSLPVPFFKMASADLTNFPLLTHTAKKGKPMILSTGMADMETVRKAVALVSAINPDIVLMQCCSSYPAPMDHLNLNVLYTYQKEFPNCVIGYSGHENGTGISLASVVMGARVVERHFTLDRTMKGGDHKASLEEEELMRLIRDVREWEMARGSFEKKRMPSEEAPFLKLAKSVVSAKRIAKGTVITRDMLTTKGPGKGISPMRIEEVVGKKTKKDIEEDVVMYDEDIEW